MAKAARQNNRLLATCLDWLETAEADDFVGSFFGRQTDCQDSGRLIATARESCIR
jgi:hypothetical protein